MMTPAPLLRVDDLRIGFVGQSSPRQEDNLLMAVRGVSFELDKAETLGLVGESGCGKSLTGLALLGLVPSPGQIVSGKLVFDGKDLRGRTVQELQKIRGAQIALIPQDPMTSLNPVYSIGSQIAEILMQHQGLSKRDALARSAELLDEVRLPNAKERLNDYPHQFSGGMRQRVMIAMALSCRPKLLIADEPTTALDVTVQAQILGLLKELQQAYGMSILMITHDLGVVAETCDRVAVMYAGQIVETAEVNTLFAEPAHPYTQGLLNSLPKPVAQSSEIGSSQADRRRLEAIEGQPPALTETLIGCAFAPRCSQRLPECEIQPPPMVNLGHERLVRCVLAQPC